MAIEASGSKSGRNNNLIIALACLALAGWFAYDGWLGGYREKELAKNDNKPTPNLIFNQYVGPIGLGAFALFCLYVAAKSSSLRIVAGEKELLVNGKRTIAYDAIRYIDQRKFAQGGVFGVGYLENGQTKEVKFSSRKYDNLQALLEELVKQTGAKPESAAAASPQA